MNDCEEYKYFETLQSAITAFGKANQEIVAIEELSELQKEITKHLRGNFNRANLVEEMADVEIILDQLRLMFDIRLEETEDVKKYKIKRLEERIKKYANDVVEIFRKNFAENN
ncbi:MAG: hypothetical protein MJ060_04910 [Clostridia bacterium]|nr:hypothetical protein [Clostridia bacterium]